MSAQRVKPRFACNFTLQPFAFKRPIESGSSPARDCCVRIAVFVKAPRPGHELSSTALPSRFIFDMLSSLSFVNGAKSAIIVPRSLLLFRTRTSRLEARGVSVCSNSCSVTPVRRHIGTDQVCVAAHRPRHLFGAGFHCQWFPTSTFPETSTSALLQAWRVAGFDHEHWNVRLVAIFGLFRATLCPICYGH